MKGLSLVAVALVVTGCGKGNPLSPSNMTQNTQHVESAAHLAVDTPMAHTEATDEVVTLPPSAPQSFTALPVGVQAQMAVYGQAAEMPCTAGLAQPGMEFIETADGRTLFRFRFAHTGNGVRIGYITFQDDSGTAEGSNPCKGFTTHPTGGYIKLVSGKWEYPAGQTNVETVLEFQENRLKCGRVQIDIAVNRVLVIGQVRESNTDCAYTPKVPPRTPEPPDDEEPVCEGDECEPPPPTCENTPSLCEPPPPVDLCVGPWSYSGSNPFSLPNSSEATELAYVQTNVSPLLTGPSKINLESKTWTSTGNFPVVIVKAAQVWYLYTNVTTGQVLQSPAFNQNGNQQNISHISKFVCATQ